MAHNIFSPCECASDVVLEEDCKCNCHTGAQGWREGTFTDDETKTLEAGGVVDRNDGNQYFSVEAMAAMNRAREKDLEKNTVFSLKEKSRARAHRELRKKVRKNKKKRMVR